MSRGMRKAMISRDHPGLRFRQQCDLLCREPVVLLLRANGPARGDSDLNAAHQRAVPQISILRVAPDDASVTARRHLRWPPPGTQIDRLMGLEAIYQAPRTSDPHPGHRIYPYLLKNMVIDRESGLVCGHNLPVQRGFLYLVAIMDWATRHVLAWRLSNTMDSRFCVEALNEALRPIRQPGNIQHRPG